MKNVANSRFTIKSWDEKPYSESQDVPKLTRAAVTKTFTGDIAGEGHVEYLMMYRSDGSATFVGLERVVGHVAGKAGSFVLQRTGIFENGVAKDSSSAIRWADRIPTHPHSPRRHDDSDLVRIGHGSFITVVI